MRVLLVSANTDRINLPTMPLGLGYVAAAARAAGHEVELLDLMLEAEPLDALGRAIEGFEPEAIGVSVRNIDDQELASPTFLLERAREVVAACRGSSAAPIVVGGPGYSIFPEAALELLGADYGVRGDGELVFPRVLERLERSEDPVGLPGVYGSGRGGEAGPSWPDLEPLPGPDEGFWAKADPERTELWVPVQTRRGCPNACSYCSTAAIQGRRIRLRPPGEAAGEVARVSRAGFRRFYIVDNVFNQPEAHALELCRHLGRLERPVEWRCIIYPHEVSEELIEAMSGAGCVEVALGFESGDGRVLREMNKRFTPEEVGRVSDRLAARGIRRMGFLLLGGPGETRESVERSLAFARSLDLEALRVTVGIRIYPGTGLWRRAVERGLIDPGDDLLRPRFYLEPELVPWIHERVAAGMVRK